MNTRKRGQRVTSRLNTGAAILEAAKAMDTQPIKDRLSAFASVTRSYVAADLEVDTAAAKLRAGSKNLQLREAGQDAAVESLARALIADGQSRTNPFAPFGSGPPSTVKELNVVEKSKAIHQLVGSVKRSEKSSKATLNSAAGADEAATKAEAGYRAMDKLQDALQHARLAREQVGQAWDSSLAALKHSTQAVADDGAPALYAALFPKTRRPRRKAPAPTPAGNSAPAGQSPAAGQSTPSGQPAPAAPPAAQEGTPATTPGTTAVSPA